MKKTLVTLDFDGAVSPIDHSRKFLEEDGWSTFGFGFRCDVHNTVLEFLSYLKLLTETGPVEVVWASTWNASTEDFESRSEGRIPGFPWIDVSVGKGEAIAAKVAEGEFERVVVLEDQQKSLNAIKKSLKTVHPVESLLVRPKVTLGITPAHIKTVKTFLKN